MNQLTAKNRTEFLAWLAEHSQTEKDCLVIIKRGRPVDCEHFWYIDPWKKRSALDGLIPYGRMLTV